MLRQLFDLTIEGAGATLVFTQNQPGILIKTSRRLRIEGLTVDYDLRTSSLGTIVENNGEKQLRIDNAYPVSSADAVHFVAEYDRAGQRWIPGGRRAIIPAGSAMQAQYLGKQGYSSAAFRQLRTGADYIVSHHWYGGAAIRIDDVPGGEQAEDIILDGVTIHSAPGMGILAYGLKRGLAVINSTVAPRPDGSNPMSTEYDAMHVLLAGGDILVRGNRFTAQGDDGLNLDSPVHPIVSLRENANTLVLSKYSRFISANDEIAAFDEYGQLLGSATVTEKPRALGGLDNEIRLSHAIPGLSTRSSVRNIALIGSRFDVSDNRIEACNCHGVVAQLPNGRIAGNTFRDLRANAIRLLTDLGSWQEGVGVFNVSVSGNTISDSGIDSAPRMPWAAISLYAAIRDHRIAPGVANRDIAIVNNIIRDSRQGCISVANSAKVRISGNRCERSNVQRNPASNSSGAIWIDPATTRDVTSP